jgi:hypothetical protein
MSKLLKYNKLRSNYLENDMISADCFLKYILNEDGLNTQGIFGETKIVEAFQHYI